MPRPHALAPSHPLPLAASPPARTPTLALALPLARPPPRAVVPFTPPPSPVLKRLTMDVASRLLRALPSVQNSSLPADRIAYARDLFPRRHIEVRGGKVAPHQPGAVVWPTSTEEVSEIVRWAAEEGVPVVPFGAGSGVCGGIVPDPRTIVLDLKKMKSVRSMDETAPLLEVESGALGITLEEGLERRGFTLGHFPSSILCSTVGGWVAARSAGQCSGKYGKIEDMVTSLECVLGDGEVVTLHRRKEGLDLTPLIIGSEGTMAVITSATLRLHPSPSSRSFGAFSFPTIEAGWTAMREMFQEGLRPAVSRLYDPFDSFIAKMGSVKRKNTDAEPKRKRRPGAGTAALNRLLRAPGALNTVIDKIGDRFLGGSTLILVFEGEADACSSDLAEASRISESLGARSLGEGPARRWLQHRYSVSYRQAPMFMSGAFVDTMEVAAPWSRLSDLYDNVRRALGRHVFVMAHLSHAYPDGSSIYFTFAGSAKSDAACEELYDTSWRAALAAAVESGGTLSHHHGVGRNKAPVLGQELGLGVEVVRALMRAADPQSILNPGNLIPKERQAPSAPGFSPTGVQIDELSLLSRAPGEMRLAEIERELGRRGLTLGLTGSLDMRMTVREWLARGAPCSRDLWEDPVDILVAGLAAELPSGARLEIRPAPRRAVGPDLTALFVGAGERYGKVLDATLRVYRKGGQPARACDYYGIRDPELNEGEEMLAARFAEKIKSVS